MNELQKLLENAGILNEGMAEQQLLYLFAALKMVVQDNRTLTAQELSDMLVTYSPDVLPPEWITKKAQKTYHKQRKTDLD